MFTIESNMSKNCTNLTQFNFKKLGVTRCTQQNCWCIQQLCEWTKLSLFKKCNCGRIFFRAILQKNLFYRKSRKKVFLQLKITTAEEGSFVDSCGRTSSTRDCTEEGSSAVVTFNCERTFFRELIYFFGF